MTNRLSSVPSGQVVLNCSLGSVTSAQYLPGGCGLIDMENRWITLYTQSPLGLPAFQHASGFFLCVLKNNSLRYIGNLLLQTHFM